MRYYEFLIESPADDVIPEIEKLGFNDVTRKSGTIVNIFAPTADRKKVQTTLLQQLQGSEKKTGGPSTLGYVLYKDAKIVVRPAGKQGVQSAGLKNEQNLIDKINDKVLTKLIKDKQIQVLPIEGEFRPSDGKQKIKIKPEVAVETTDEQTADLVFGSDLLAGQGGVVKETFEDEHYTLKANNLTVTCDVVIKDPSDIPDRMKVYMLIRNSKDRNRPSSPYPGTKVQAAYASRAKNALILDTDLNVVRPAKSQLK